MYSVPQPGLLVAATLVLGLMTAVPAHAERSGADLIRFSDCAACHAQRLKGPKLPGPSYEAIAQRYRNDPKAPGKLVERIKNGGSGNWGKIPMLPHRQFSQAELEAIAQYLLHFK